MEDYDQDIANALRLAQPSEAAREAQRIQAFRDQQAADERRFAPTINISNQGQVMNEAQRYRPMPSATGEPVQPVQPVQPGMMGRAYSTATGGRNAQADMSSALENLPQPMEYFDDVAKAARESSAYAKQGINKMGESGNPFNQVVGGGEYALGSLGYLVSPFTGAVTNLVTNPAKKVFGEPFAQRADIVANLIDPFSPTAYVKAGLAAAIPTLAMATIPAKSKAIETALQVANQASDLKTPEQLALETAQKTAPLPTPAYNQPIGPLSPPVVPKGSSASQAVDLLAETPKADADAIRANNQGTGLVYPEDEALERLRLKLSRKEPALALGEKAQTSSVGDPLNERRIIRAPRDAEGNPIAGKPDFTVGKITPQDWVNRAESMMNDNEIQEASTWYGKIRSIFNNYTGGDSEKTNKYMKAWLVGQQNVDVAGSLKNVFLQAEQFARKIPEAEMTGGGMPNPTYAIRQVLKDEPIEYGVGQKISDFVDSAENKPVRSWMANHPDGGSPFVVDVHTARDTGLVDQKLINHLTKLGYNTEDLKNLKLDFSDAISPQKYENRSEFGHEITNYLNSITWKGRNDWTPLEVQAVGWMGMTRLTADKAEDVVSGFERNLRRISMEAAPGEGSPIHTLYNNRFSVLSLPEKETITQNITNKALEDVSNLVGIDLRSIAHGSGGWNMDINPSSVGQVYATPQAAQMGANILGHILQQSEVWSNSVKPLTQNPSSFAIDFLENGTTNLRDNTQLADFWSRIQKADPDKKKPLFVGYQPISTPDGRIGIRVLIDRGGAKLAETLTSAIEGPIQKELNNIGYDVSAQVHEAEIYKAQHDWKGDPSGQSYITAASNLLGRDSTSDLNNLREKYQEQFRQELESAEDRTKRQGTSTIDQQGLQGSPEEVSRQIDQRATAQNYIEGNAGAFNKIHPMF